MAVRQQLRCWLPMLLAMCLTGCGETGPAMHACEGQRYV